MFKKLKEKITEEVKSSPQRFQQLTQSVSDKLQNSSSISDENFFSIGDDDANNSSASIEAGFSNVSLTSPQESRFRRNSNSSIQSDVSFLPRYDSVANMYHLQSDLDISASELEDNASTASSQLGHLTKEQIYSAFQKSQLRYHKYRGRYTDLAKHYKDLERENGKMKAVLVETQDKAIRRVTELKEQCALEQKAKAHLEGALRDELDEKQLKIASLQQKVTLIQQNGNGGGGEQDGESLETLTKYLTEARQEIELLNNRLQEMKANSIIFQTKEQEYKVRISNYEKDLLAFSEREKENNLSLAQHKMELHNEILNKDAELSNLKQDCEVLRQSLEAFETKSSASKLENLQTQNNNLIEKLENLNLKCMNQESDVLKLEQLKIENSNLKLQLKQSEELLETVRDETKQSLLSLEGRISEKYSKDYEIKLEKVRSEHETRIKEISGNSDAQLELIQRDNEIKTLLEELEQVKRDYNQSKAKYDELERNHLELIEEGNGLRAKIAKESVENESKMLKLEEEKSKLSLKLKQLEESSGNVQNNLIEEKNSLVKIQEEFQAEKVKQQAIIDNLTKMNEKIIADYENRIKSYEIDNQSVQNQMKTLENEKNTLEKKVKELKSVLNQSEINLKQKESENVALLDQIRVGQEEVEGLKMLENRLKDSEDEKNEISSKLEECKSILGEKTKELVKAEEELKELKENSSKRKNEENSALENEVTILKNELEKAEENFNSFKIQLTKEIEGKYKEKLMNELKTIQEKSEKEQLQLTKQTEEKYKETLKKFEENSQREQLQLTQELEDKFKDKLQTIQENSEKEKLQLTQEIEEKYKEKLKTIQENSEKQKLQLTQEIEEKYKAKLKTIEESSQNEKSKLAEEVEENYKLKLKNEMEKLAESEKTFKKQLEITTETYKTKELELKQEISKIQTENEERIQQIRVETQTQLQNSQEKLKDLEKELTVNSQSTHKELSDKISEYERKIQTQNNTFDLIIRNLDEKTENFVKTLNELPSISINRPKNNKSLQNLQDKLNYLKELCEFEENSLRKALKILREENGSQTRQLQIAENNSKEFESEKQRLIDEIKELQNRVQEILTEKSCLENSAGRFRETEQELVRLREEIENLAKEKEAIRGNIEEIELRNLQISDDNKFLASENTNLVQEVAELKLAKTENTSKKFIEYEHVINELNHEKQLLQDEIQELKTIPINKLDNLEIVKKQEIIQETEKYLKEIEILRDKLTQYKSLDLTNKTSIEFYENELEKFKNKNEKLKRKLDETLVTLNHCTELSNSTEIEYLKHVLYNYMLGKESIVLARVIAAVCKFDPQQTETILAKEQQKQTLLGQLGIL